MTLFPRGEEETASAALRSDESHVVERPRSWARRSLASRLQGRKMALAGAGIILFMVAFCFLGPFIYRTDQDHSNPLSINLAPSWGHLLGTDENGFDTVG